jgi:E3 ubiquitin-protein ligase SHPRH
MANTLQRVIRGLFGIPKGAPVYSGDLRSAEDVTARQVYQVVDNQQIEKFVQEKKDFPTLDIPGLLPTLRPYQAAAVQWMLQRETNPEVGDEWKVLWMVLDSKARQNTPLSDWNSDEKHTNLLYCPFNGWVATSIKEAQRLILGDHVKPVRGGCLAEQMGLGKSVELLACILANPMPNPPDQEAISVDPSCARRLDFGDDQNLVRNPSTVATAGEVRNVGGVVNDMNDFADEESSDEDEDAAMVTEVALGQSKVPVVTPEKNYDVTEDMWMDEQEVGSCICGEIITFPSSARKQQKTYVVLCKLCHAPMHMECSCLDPGLMERQKRINLRRSFGNEKLECVLTNTCPCCAVLNEPIISKATIIVCPPTILDQWGREVTRHTSGDNGQPLKVLVYDGVKKITNQSKSRRDMRLLHPKYLADTDIILIPFEALMSDLNHSDDNAYITGRKRKRYRIVPTPLLSIHFWRVAIDEAQRVEVTTTKAAKMALKLKANNFWAISGTPIGHGKLQDVYGIFLFLGLAPFDDKNWFQSCLGSMVAGVDKRFQALLDRCFWRSTKASSIIKRQLGIPEMTENRVILKFSSIEKHFYSNQLEATLRLAGASNATGGVRKSSEIIHLSESIQRLRAACCHPQVGTHGVGGGRLKRQRHGHAGENSVAAKVMSMENILETLISDARLKCEEAQRVAIMHTNAMAGICRLKVKARGRGVSVDQDDRTLLLKSGDTYRESLSLAKNNATPTRASGEAVLTGNIGFLSSNKTFDDGRCTPSWKMQRDFDQVWTKIEYQGSARKLRRLRVKSQSAMPSDLLSENSDDFTWQIAVPTSIVLQVAMASDQSEFYDVIEAPLNDSWTVVEKFALTNKSKSWKIVVKFDEPLSCNSSRGFFIGLEIELDEAQIGSDSLQLLHSLHNACLSYEAALKIQSEDDTILSDSMLAKQIEAMKKEAKHIEYLYKKQPQSEHKAYMTKFRHLRQKRVEKEKEMFHVTEGTHPRKKLSDVWDDGWFDDFLGAMCLYGTEAQQTTILDRIMQDVEGINVVDASLRFPDFQDLSGLRTAINFRLSKIRSEGLGKKHATLPATVADNEFVQIRCTRYKCSPGEHAGVMDSISNLSTDPSTEELEQNSHCRLCKADWNQTGPVCRHCHLSLALQDLRPDSVTAAVLAAVYTAVRTPVAASLLINKGLSNVIERAKLFFEVLDIQGRETVAAWSMWRAHLSLLNEYDVLKSTKTSMRLSYEGENLLLYTEEQLNAIVQPVDLIAKYHEHTAKQAMALGDLRRATGTLHYLQNQRKLEQKEKETCLVCLSVLEGECCVLKCGHRFHREPCFDRILRSKAGLHVECPKCRARTEKYEVMVATDKRSDDGSEASRKVIGSWGTKVTRIVSDILDIRDKGEKAVIFSQWHTMLQIVEAALLENGISTSRPKGGARFKDGIHKFQSPECTVLLLHLKQGAEGLTLVEATHVFMIEPVMNSGLDQQAINRIHRIGQTKICHVWRYLVEDTIEIKLDKLRRDRQQEADAFEDCLPSPRFADLYSAGGCDGGFASKEDLMEILE